MRDNEPLPLIDPERLGGDAEPPSCLPGAEPLLLFAAHTRPSVPDPRFCKGGPRVRCKSSSAGSFTPTAHTTFPGTSTRPLAGDSGERLSPPPDRYPVVR